MQKLKGHTPQRIPLRWRLLVLFLVMCGIGCLLAWAILLTSFCSHPKIPGPAAYRDLSYNCHGMIVSISPKESMLRHWLLPAGFGLVFSGLVTAGRALVVAGFVRLNLSVKVTDTSDRGRRS